MFYSAALKNIFLTKNNSVSNQCTLVFFAWLFLSIASQISIPLQPVPITFQSIAVVFIGMALGPRLGAYTILSYLAAAGLGLPVLAELSGGIHYLYASPSSGYLLGFLPAVIVSGGLAQTGFACSIFLSYVAALIGAAIIFACGILFLSHLFGLEKALLFGLYPFLITEFIKIGFISFLIPRILET